MGLGLEKSIHKIRNNKTLHFRNR